MYLTRHSEMIKEVNLDQHIVVFGAGSIGSYAVLALAKLGYKNITVLDDGIVEEENIAPQFYKIRDIGKFKVDCLKRAILDLTGTSIIAIPKRYDSETRDQLEQFFLEPSKTVILTVDSMRARSYISSHTDFLYLVDSRMAIEFLTIVSAYTEADELVHAYQDTLFSDENAVQENCTNKAISYTSLIAGGIVAKCVLDLHKGINTGIQTINFDINSFDMVRL